MIARINIGSGPGGAVRYNEDKVINGEARVIDLVNFPSNHPELLSVRDKVSILEDLTDRNPKVSEPTIHIALAFHPTDKMTDELLKTIATEYMDRLGYGNQPTVVYRHEDTQHPHIHIVTVAIDDEGKKISDSLIRVRSNDVRRDIEIKYHLIKAEEQINELAIGIFSERAIEYGKGEIKKAIGTVIQTAFKDYSFSNLKEFDQFIKNYGVQMNVREGKGEKNWRGLTFQITDGDKPLSPEVKASAYHFAPTYQKLQARFHGGGKKKALHQPQLIADIRECLKGVENGSEADFKGKLREKSIQVVDNGKTFLYIDHKKRTVYSEADLGPLYARATIVRNLVAESMLRPSPPQQVATPPAPGVIKESQLTQAERAALGKLVSRQYQQYKKDNNIPFESQLIRAFPFPELVAAVKAGGKDERLATLAVTEFERYKKEQLPDVLSKERAYFDQSATAYLTIARQMPITAESRLQFLEKVQLKLVQQADGSRLLQHEKNSDLTLLISPKQYQELMNGTSQKLLFMQPLKPAEKRLYLSAAHGTPLAEMTFYDVRIGQLKKALPVPIFESISAQLNAFQLKALGQSQLPQSDQLTNFYYQRGMVVALDKGLYKAGFHSTPPASFQLVTGPWLAELQTAGLPAGYAESSAKLGTEPGRFLIQYVQGLDHQSVARTSFVERKVAEGDKALTGLQGQALVTALQMKIDASPLPRPYTISTLMSNNRPADAQTERINTLLFRDYSRFRIANGFYFESSLLRKPEQFPFTRLTGFLTEPPHNIEPKVAAEAVANLKARRLGMIDKIKQKDQTNFHKASIGYLAMLGQAPLSAKDKLGVLNALSITLDRSPTAQRLVYQSDPSFHYTLTKAEAVGIGAGARQPQRITVPEKEFPRYERQLYETLALGGKLTHNSEKSPITFLSIHAERVKTIVTPGQWEGAGRWLNDNTLGAALLKAPIDGADKLRWLYQRGLVVEPTREGYRVGHYLTKPEQFTPVPASLVAVLKTNSGLQMPAPAQQQALETPRGKIMVELATLMDNGKPKQIEFMIKKIVGKMPEYEPLKNDPKRLLDLLSTTSGPYKEVMATGQQNSYEDTIEPQEDKTDNLSALGQVMDTSGMRKKNRSKGQTRMKGPKNSQGPKM